MEGDRQRLGQRRRARREPVGDAAKRPGVDHDEAGEGSAQVLVHTGASLLALGRLALAAPAAPPAARRGPTDDDVAGRPLAHTGADKAHGARILVSGDRARLAPALDQQVEVRPAHTAVVDLDQHLSLSRLGHRTSFHPDPARA